MRWLPWRRKQARPGSGDKPGAVAVADRPAPRAVLSPTHVEPRGAALAFAHDALALSGAHVRVEDPDLIAITLPDGTRARYTGSLARARGEADATLLVQGGAALGTLLDDVALRGGYVAFALPATGDPLALAVAAVSEPPVDCGRCASGKDAESVALCAACPLRVGRLALRGVGRVTGARELARREALAIELTYRVTYRDRDGRRDELHRLAYDVRTGEQIAPLAPAAAATGEPRPLPADVDVTAIAERAEADLRRTLEAGASLLALRAEAEYQRRLHDIALTHARLLRESPEARGELEAGHGAERARVADLFAVGVDAELVGIAHVTTTLAQVAVRHTGGELALTVDLGRGVAMPPCCALCGTPSRAGTLCPQGHLICPSCALAADAGASTSCPVCAQESRLSAPARPRPRRHGSQQGAAHPSDSVTPERLADLSETLWQAFVSWYLADEGYAAEVPEVRHGLPLWRLRVDARERAEHAAEAAEPERVVALRPANGRLLGAADVRAALDTCRDEPRQVVLLVTPALAAEDTLREAAAAGVRVVERDALAAFLARMATAHATALAEAERDTEARAQAAIETQRAMLGALTEVEKVIATCVNSRRATGRGPLAAATNTITAALREAERALVAWETLVADWLASFDERTAPDGSLGIVSSPEELRELAERAGHLRGALERPIGALAATPGTGESGYTAWRKALVEQLTAACEALCWRISVVNVERWRDATAARDANAAAHAETAVQSAKHTAARAAKARDVLAGRIGL